MRILSLMNAVVAVVVLGPVSAPCSAQWVAQPAARTDSLVQLAHREQLAGRYGNAMSMLESELAALKHQPSEATRAARLLATLGLVQSQAAAYDGFSRDSTLATLDLARHLADSTGEAQGLADALTGIGWAHYWKAFEDTTASWDVPRRYFHSADSIHRALGDSVGIAEGHFRLGLIHERKGQTDSMLARYRTGEALARRRGYDLELSYLVRHLGGYFEEVTKQFDSALVYQRESLALREKAGFRPGEVFALIAIGDVQRVAGRTEDARASYREALRRAEKISVRRALEVAREAAGRP